MVKINDVLMYNQGWIRYRLFYSKELYKINLKFLIRKYIREQIDMRIRMMNQECYEGGSCIKCGCTTPPLQMCNKICDGNCYPRLFNKKEWKILTVDNKYLPVDRYGNKLYMNLGEKFPNKEPKIVKIKSYE